MNFQSDPASVNFSCCGVLVPMGRRMVSLLGRWYSSLSTAFNKIRLSKSHVLPEFIAVLFILSGARRGLFCSWQGKEHVRRYAPLQRRVNRLWDQRLQKQVERQGLSDLRRLTKASLSKEAWGERKCHAGLHPAPTKVCCCVGWEQDLCAKGSATRLKCHQSCGSTSLQPALLRDYCGQWKGREDFPERVGGGKATLRAGNASDDVQITLTCVFPEIKG